MNTLKRNWELMKMAWNNFLSSAWSGVTKRQPPELTSKGMAAYHKRWADEFRSIADRKCDKRHEQYWRRMANKHDEQARTYDTNG